ncbi:MAG: 6-phosphogluconolactonase [Micromonosporaceae bacterium]|nr:6-phosphogluconolactonase [Micromonosporaceae bacterium]
MRIIPEIHHSPEEVGRALAAPIADGIAAAARQGRRYLLGCPAGRSALPVYRALAEQVPARGLNVAHLVLVLMDDYLEPAGAALRRVPEDLPYSCVGFARRQIAEPLGGATGQQPQVWVPEPGDPAGYDRRIREAGGIDMFILASGASDGHVAFNPPGSPRDSTTRVVRLSEATRLDNLATFPEFDSLAAVPRLGVSVGISTIADQSRQAVMVLHGPDKARAYQRLRAATGYEPDWPATVVAACHSPRILADTAATSGEPATRP